MQVYSTSHPCATDKHSPLWGAISLTPTTGLWEQVILGC